MKFAIVEGTVIFNKEQKQEIDQIAGDLINMGHEVEVFVAEDSKFCSTANGLVVNKLSGVFSYNTEKTILNSLFVSVKRELALRSLYNKVMQIAKPNRFDAVVYPEATCSYMRVLSMHELIRGQVPMVFIIQGLVPRDCKNLGSYSDRLLLKTNIRIAVPRSGKYGFEVAVPNIELIYSRKLAEHIVTLATD